MWSTVHICVCIQARRGCWPLLLSEPLDIGAGILILVLMIEQLALLTTEPSFSNHYNFYM